MEAGGDMYARVPDKDPARLEAAIRAVRKVPTRGPLGVLKFDPAAHDFAVIDRWGKSDDVPSWSGKHAEGDDLAALSREVGDVVAHYDVDGTSHAELAHWHQGALVRSLSFGDGQWMTVEGTPQAWESAFFEGAREQEMMDLFIDEPDKQAKVKAAFAARTIERGAQLPWPMPRVWQALRAPAWGFAPWPRRREVVAKL